MTFSVLFMVGCSSSDGGGPLGDDEIIDIVTCIPEEGDCLGEEIACAEDPACDPAVSCTFSMGVGGEIVPDCNSNANCCDLPECELTEGLGCFFLSGGQCTQILPQLSRQANESLLTVASSLTCPFEVCTFVGDEDGNQLADCNDPACVGEIGTDGEVCPPIEVAEICNDSIDNDNDGDVDCRDRDCAGFSFDDGTKTEFTGKTLVCQLSENICDDGFDNDGINGADCFDSKCCNINPLCAGQGVCPRRGD